MSARSCKGTFFFGGGVIAVQVIAKSRESRPCSIEIQSSFGLNEAGATARVTNPVFNITSDPDPIMKMKGDPDLDPVSEHQSIIPLK